MNMFFTTLSLLLSHYLYTDKCILISHSIILFHAPSSSSSAHFMQSLPTRLPKWAKFSAARPCILGLHFMSHRTWHRFDAKQIHILHGGKVKQGTLCC